MSPEKDTQKSASSASACAASSPCSGLESSWKRSTHFRSACQGK